MAFISILLVALWHGTGYLMMIYIAAIQSMPSELIEASVIDGAGAIQRFRHVIFPLLMPAVTVCLFLTLNGSFKIFDTVFSMTKGGPGYATEVIALNIYREGFANNMRFGYATAKSIILFFIILVITVFQVTATKRREVEM
jgi:raffinose/stachyose/melibiose transport system permease protein